MAICVTYICQTNNMNRYIRCRDCGHNLPYLHYMIDVHSSRRMKICNICEKMKQYKDYHNKWCSTCKIYIEKSKFDVHVHSNLFARSKFDFKTRKLVVKQYFDEIKRRIEGGAIDYLKKAVTLAYLDRVSLNDLLPENDVKDLQHSNITSVKSLLLNIDYFKKETFRENHYKSAK